jgi:hypothetical protein
MVEAKNAKKAGAMAKAKAKAAGVPLKITLKYWNGRGLMEVTLYGGAVVTPRPGLVCMRGSLYMDGSRCKPRENDRAAPI